MKNTPIVSAILAAGLCITSGFVYSAKHLDMFWGDAVFGVAALLGLGAVGSALFFDFKAEADKTKKE